MTLSPLFSNRDFSLRPGQPQPPLAVSRLEWSAFGGPSSAVLTGVGPGDHAALADLLRCPVEIYDQAGRPAWWGYVHAVRFMAGDWPVGLSLDGLYNAVAVLYTLLRPPPFAPYAGQPVFTPWTVDSASQAVYGQKQLVASLPAITTAAALARRDQLLATCKYPSAEVFQHASNQPPAFAIECRGWWSTLAWMTYTVNLAITETTAQLAAAITACGQFLSGSVFDCASGVLSTNQREGHFPALSEMLDLMSLGGPSGRRLLSWVSRERLVRIFEEPPPSTASIAFDSAGFSVPGNLACPELIPPVGQWLRLRGVELPANQVSFPALDSCFLEAASWTPSGGYSLHFARRQPLTGAIIR